VAELDQRLLDEGDGHEMGRPDACGLEAETDGATRRGRVAFMHR
jgi:hypothetical protein